MSEDPKPEESSKPKEPQSPTSPKGLALSDFEIGLTLGHGSFGKVFVATRKTTGKKYAIKMLDKQHITRFKKEATVINEKKILQMLDYPSIIKLYFTFQDSTSLYYVLELCDGGELCDEIRRVGKFELSVTRFYAAEVVKTLEYLHGKGILHRDLKPENLLLSETRHIKLCDFGTSKLPTTAADDAKRKKSFVGTAEYVPPELLNDKYPVGIGADLWALGCVIFQMLAGHVPFKGASEWLTFKKIEAREFEFPKDFPASAKDLVDKLLCIEPTKRLGYSSYEELKTHSFFDGIKWETLFDEVAPVLPATVSSSSSTQSKKKEKDGGDGGEDSDDEQTSETTTTETTSTTTSTTTITTTTSATTQDGKSKESSLWDKFLLETEHVVFQSLVKIKKGLIGFANKRQLILTDFPRFIQVDVEKPSVKAEIQWSSELWAEFKDAQNFIIYTPAAKYSVCGLNSGAKEWVDNINKVKKSKLAKQQAETTK